MNIIGQSSELESEKNSESDQRVRDSVTPGTQGTFMASECDLSFFPRASAQN